jgi:6-phosphogluconolactonase
MKVQLLAGVTMSSLLFVVGCGDDAAGGNSTASAGNGGTGAGAGGESAGGADGSGGTGNVGNSGSGAAGGGAVAETGYVFTMSNASEGNEVLVFERGDDGTLTEGEPLPTGGMGSGDGLGSQGALAISPDRDFLYVVNAGSNQISSFRIYDDHLALVDLVSSGGERPISLSASDDRLYVVNAGGAGSVRGFATAGGELTPIAGADRPLSGSGTGPAQVGLTPNGEALIVTEKGTDSLLTYWVAPDGSLSQATVTASEGMTPFGFDFTPDGTLIVSEAFGGMPGLSAVSSYSIGSVEPMPISSSVPSDQTAACWTIIAQGEFAYTTNTASNTISGYHVASDGSVSLFDDGGETVIFGENNSPLDMALSDGHEFLYVLNGASDLVVGFTIGSNGALSEIAAGSPVPMTSLGLVAR